MTCILCDGNNYLYTLRVTGVQFITLGKYLFITLNVFIFIHHQ